MLVVAVVVIAVTVAARDCSARAVQRLGPLGGRRPLLICPARRRCGVAGPHRRSEGVGRLPWRGIWVRVHVSDGVVVQSVVGMKYICGFERKGRLG